MLWIGYERTFLAKINRLFYKSGLKRTFAPQKRPKNGSFIPPGVWRILEGMVYIKREDRWNFIFSVFFVGVLVAAVWHLGQLRGGYSFSVPAFDMALMAFATMRLTRLIVYDKIARWFRDLFDYNNGFCVTVRDLLACPWCIGIWSALVIVYCYFVFPWAWLVILFLALAGMGSLLQVVANAVGWKAETLKMEAREKGSL